MIVLRNCSMNAWIHPAAAHDEEASLTLGSARVSRVGEGVSPSRTFQKACFGETPKPTRETRALPRILIPAPGPTMGPRLVRGFASCKLRRDRCRFGRSSRG